MEHTTGVFGIKAEDVQRGDVLCNRGEVDYVRETDATNTVGIDYCNEISGRTRRIQTMSVPKGTFLHVIPNPNRK